MMCYLNSVAKLYLNFYCFQIVKRVKMNFQTTKILKSSGFKKYSCPFHMLLHYVNDNVMTCFLFCARNK